MKKLLPLVVLALVACTTAPPGATRADAINAAAGVAASVADAIGQAPPATLNRTDIDERAIRAALHTFDGALDIINSAIDAGLITPGTPRALQIRTAVQTIQAALNAAHAAQKAGSATTYRDALEQARVAVAHLTALL